MYVITVPLTVKELENTYVVLFIGYVLGMTAYGFTFFQTYDYHSRYPQDHWVIKAMVGSLCLLDTANSALISHALYYYLIFSFPDTPALVNVAPTYCAEIGISTLSILIVQIYYSYRVWIVSQNAAVAAGIAIVSLAAFALGIVAIENLAKTLLFASLTTLPAKAIMASSQGLTFLSGFAAFAVLSFYLNSRQDINLVRDPMDNSTGRLPTFFVGCAITRGSLAAIVQFGYFVAFTSMPTKPFWMPFHLLASRVFINSLLAMLNLREIHHGHGVNEGEIGSRKTATTSSSSAPRLSSSNIRVAIAESRPTINIQVSRTDNRDTTSKVILHDGPEADGWHSKRPDSEV